MRAKREGARSSAVQSAEFSADFDFEDVGPTEVQEEWAGQEGDLPPSYTPFGPGQVLGHYRIDRVLGRGAMGIVYEASHLVVQKRAAVKCLFPHAAEEPTQVQRLFREAKIAARVQHPNVVQVYDAGRHQDTFYLAMELLEGRTLADVLSEARLPIESIVNVFLQVMSGVAAVHAVGVVHRDLKPENIFMQTRPERPNDLGLPKVLDFGVSKLKEQGPSTKLTAMGIVMGTPFYMATEQVVDTSAVDQRADVYSLGVMLYEALSGTLPYPGRSVVEIFAKAQEGRPRPLRELRPDVPPSLEALVSRALCADKEARFASVTTMRDALAAVPLDGTDEWEEWSDVSQPWMLDKANADLHALGGPSLHSMPPPAEPVVPLSMPTPLTNPRPPIEPPTDLSRSGLPLYVWLLIAALAGTLCAGLVALGLYFVLA